MFTYRAIERGFFKKRVVNSGELVHTSQPFPKKGKVEQVPRWLERVKATKKETRSSQKAEADKLNKAKQAVKDKDKAIETASFMEEPSNISDIVQTL